MRKAAVRHPVVASAIVVVIFVVTMFIGSFILLASPPVFIENGEFVQQMVIECIICLAGIALTGIFGYFNIWNNTERFGRGLACGGYILVVSTISGLSGLAMSLEQIGGNIAKNIEPGWKILCFVVTCALIGIGEESFFRGVVANLFWDKHAKDPAGVWTATIYSGLIFGLMHGSNLLSSNKEGVLVQMAGVIAMGMALTAIYYRSKNIWSVIFLHAFLDFCGLLPSGIFGGSITEVISSYSPVVAITSTLPYLVLTLFLLRKSKMPEILAANPLPGYYQPPGTIVLSYEINSSPESKRSRRRAIIIALIIWTMLFCGCVVAHGGFDDYSELYYYTGDEVFSYEDEGTWSGERTFGVEMSFTAPAGSYHVSVESRPSDPQTYVFVQILKGDEVWFEDNYGGLCVVGCSLDLDAGQYTVNIIYNFSEVDNPSATYDFDMEIVG